MGAQSNLQVIVDLYESFDTGDSEAMLRPFTDESVWVEPGKNLRSGLFRGQQGIFGHTMSCMELTDGTWATEVKEIVGGEKHVVVLEQALGRRNGKSLAMPCATIYEMEDGTITQMRVLPFDSEGWHDFWS
jgi:ketosteroid isomerase-like protein